jgi:hypothetical protein
MTEETKTAIDSTNENVYREEESKTFLEELEITMDKRIDSAVAAAIVLLGLFLLIATRYIREGSMPDPLTARGLPYVTGLFLVIGGIIQVVRQVLTWSEIPGNMVPEEGQADEKGYPASWVPCFSIIALSFMWEWLLKPLGFLIVTPLYIFISSLIMGEREWLKIIAFSIIFSLANWIIFGPLLGIRFPLGPLNHLALSLGLVS